METFGLRHFRIYATAAVIMLVSAFVDTVSAQNTKSIDVTIEQPIADGNVAKAKEAAQLQAFRKAVEMTLPVEMASDAKESKLRRAPQSIKSFTVMNEQNDGRTLRMVIRCQVILEVASAPITSTGSSSNSWIEVTWDPRTSGLNVSDLLNHLQDTASIEISSLKMVRGSVLFGVPSNSSAESVRGNLANFIGSKGSVRVVNRTMPEAVPVESGSPTPLEPLVP